MYDTIIIGMGPAGMSAGIYAKRSGLKTLILESNYPGGLLNKVSVVDNYLGIKNVSGADLALNMFEHIKDVNVDYKIEKVLSIKNDENIKTITTTKGTYDTRSIIFAIGRKAKKSGITNEEKYNGKGVSYCALCDGALYKNKDIVVLGGGNSAFEEAIYLSKIAKSVQVLVRSEIRAEDALVEELKKCENVIIVTGVTVEEIIGDDVVNSVRLNSGDIIECQGVFVYFGYEAETSFLNNLDITDEKGYILVDATMRTKVKNIYACGDIIKKDLYQIVTAASEGAIAATSARKDLK